MNEEKELTHEEIIRRTMILCCSFARNISFHKIGWKEENKHLLSEYHPEASFWRQINSNFIDIAVLEWCKIFAEPKNGRHSWKKIVKCEQEFEASLLSFIGESKESFQQYIDKMKRYRDKFVAHLDQDREMNLPEFKIAENCIIFYQKYIYEHEVHSCNLKDCPKPSDFEEGFQQCADEADRVYLLGRRE